MGEGARDGWPPETARDMVKPQLFDVLTTGNGIPGRSLPDHRPLTWADLKVHPRLPVHSDESIFTGLLPCPPPPQPLSLTIGKPMSPSPQNSDTYPVRAPNPPRDPVLIVSTMIAMPTPPPVNPRILSEDTFPPVLFGVTHIPIPCGWASADV